MLSRIAVSSLVLSCMLSNAWAAPRDLRGGVAPRRPGIARPAVNVPGGAQVLPPAAQTAITAQLPTGAPGQLPPALSPFGDRVSEIAREKGRLMRESVLGVRTAARANARTDARLGAPGQARRAEVHARNDAAAQARESARAARREEGGVRPEEATGDLDETAHARGDDHATRKREKREKIATRALLKTTARAGAELPDVGF